MAFWSRRGKDSIPYWRDRHGAIVCKGNKCIMSQCGEDCPVWLNDQGVSYIENGQKESALRMFENAIALAPDFAKAWSNIGQVYWESRQYVLAKDAFSRAYSLSHEPKALFGLTVSNRDCGYYDEALRYCEEYRTKFPDGRMDDIYIELVECLKKDLVLSMLRASIDKLHGKHQISTTQDKIPSIPDVIAFASPTCAKIYAKYYENRGKGSYSSLSYSDNVYMICGCAGISAVYLWKKDLLSLEKEGLYQTLTHGSTLDSIKGRAIELMFPDSRFRYTGHSALEAIFDSRLHDMDDVCKKESENPKYDRFGQAFKEQLRCETMYFIGMIYAMEKLEMR